MKFAITPKRIMLGVALSALFVLASIGNFSSHKWNAIIAFLAAITGTILAFGAAFSVRASPSVGTDGIAPASAGRQFLNKVVLWVVMVIVLLGTMKILDSLHVPWRQWIH